MPYSTNTDLPSSVRNILPQPAQDIYRTVFNKAWQEYTDISKHRDTRNLEEIAHRVAWSAVKTKYEKADGHWVPRS